MIKIYGVYEMIDFSFPAEVEEIRLKVRNFMDDASSIRGAFEAYVAAVKGSSFPDDTLHAW